MAQFGFRFHWPTYCNESWSALLLYPPIFQFRCLHYFHIVGVQNIHSVLQPSYLHFNLPSVFQWIQVHHESLHQRFFVPVFFLLIHFFVGRILSLSNFSFKKSSELMFETSDYCFFYSSHLRFLTHTFFFIVPLSPVVECFRKAGLILPSPATTVFLVTSFPTCILEDFFLLPWSWNI